jgi:hypothetical protein
MFITARFMPRYFANGITASAQAGPVVPAGDADALDQVKGSLSA